MSDESQPNEQTRQDQNDEVAPKRVGFMLDPLRSRLDDLADAVQRDWVESNLTELEPETL